jgi:hypothetical protein
MLIMLPAVCTGKSISTAVVTKLPMTSIKFGKKPVYQNLILATVSSTEVLRVFERSIVD